MMHLRYIFYIAKVSRLEILEIYLHFIDISDMQENSLPILDNKAFYGKPWSTHSRIGRGEKSVAFLISNTTTT